MQGIKIQVEPEVKKCFQNFMGDGTISNDESFINDKIETSDYNSGVAHSFGISYSDKIFKWRARREEESTK